MRVFLAVLLALTSFPAQAADPLVELLVTHRAAGESFEDASASDVREAAGEPDPQTLDLGRLANLQSGLSMMAQGIEAFRHPSHDAEAHKLLMRRLPPEVRPYYDDRDRGLDTLYRTLALVDYTAALRYEAPPCEARERRRTLLHSGDGLFVDPKTGQYSAWLKSILKRAKAGPASETERASAATKLEGVEYDRALARVRGLSDALQDPKLEAEKRAESYCTRAAIYENLAAAHRTEGGLIQAARAVEPSTRFADALSAVAAVETARGIAAATALDVGGRVVLLTSARMLADPATGRPPSSVPLEFKDGGKVDAAVSRWDLERDLALLEMESPPSARLRLSEASPKRAERVYAVGHPEQGGRWSVTQGLVTRTTSGDFHSDALIAAGSAGGPVLNEEGAIVGLATVRPKDEGALEAGAALKAPEVETWIAGSAESDVHESAVADYGAIEDWGTGSILTAASASIAPKGAPIEAGIQGVCVAYCDGPPSSSYSRSSGGSSGGGEAIVGMAMVLGVAVAGVGYLIWQGLKALAKSLPKASPRSSSAAKVEKGGPKVKEVSAIPTPQPKPKPRLSIEWKAPERVMPGGEEKVVVKVTSDQPGVNLQGIPVEISADSGGQKIQLTTGRDGTATFILKISPEQQDFEDLRRQSQLIVSAAPIFPTLALAAAAGGSVTLTATLVVPSFAILATSAALACVIYVGYDAARKAIDRRRERLSDPVPAQVPARQPLESKTVIHNAALADDALEREAKRSLPAEGLSYSKEDDRESLKGVKPKNCPTGTRPIDQVPELKRDGKHEKIKKGVGAGPRDWTGITPDGEVITRGENGEAVRWGHYEDYLQ